MAAFRLAASVSGFTLGHLSGTQPSLMLLVTPVIDAADCERGLLSFLFLTFMNSPQCSISLKK